MFKKYKYIFFFFILSACVEQQGLNKEESLQDEISPSGNVLDFGFQTDLSEDIAAYKTVVSIVRETGLSQNFIILPGDVEKVQAYIEDNERILEYNPDFIENIQAKKNWYGISILARQIGHHLSKHELEGGVPSIEENIKADELAGFVLFKMGASIGEAIEALESVIADNDNHQKGIPKNTRITSLAKGWNNAKTLMTDTMITSNNEAIDSLINLNPKRKRRQYAYRVFLAIDKKMYFIDSQGKVYEEVSNLYIPVGLKKDSDKTGFDWIFVKEGDSYGVDLKGRLWAFSSDGNFHIVGQAIKLNIK
ncbi:MAG: hypothetical protein CMD18_06810 [Flavobacteriales bacterium]|nr:hypothetical protein [Flavobacteriales bacterium]